jgi:hypothetical protein
VLPLVLLILLAVVIVVPSVVVSVVPRVVRTVVPSVMRALAKEGVLDAARDAGTGPELRAEVEQLRERIDELEERSDFLERALAEVRRDSLPPSPSGGPVG